jgi:hypothetical protein
LLAKGSDQHLATPDIVNVYYIPLKSFTEMSTPHPRIIQVNGLEGRSSHPVLSPTGDSTALLKKQHPTDLSDRNRVVVINDIRNFHSQLAIGDVPTRQSRNGWYLSPQSIAWSEDGQELYVIAVEAGVAKLYKLPATLSSIKVTPEPLSDDSKSPEDLRHLRMVASAPMNNRSTHLSLILRAQVLPLKYESQRYSFKDRTQKRCQANQHQEVITPFSEFHMMWLCALCATMLSVRLSPMCLHR